MREQNYSPIGQRVIVRCRDAAVHAGILLAEEGRTVTLDVGARRIWYWSGAATLSELAGSGTSDPTGCKFPAPSPTRVRLLDACEILIVTDEAWATLEAVPVWTEH